MNDSRSTPRIAPNTATAAQASLCSRVQHSGFIRDFPFEFVFIETFYTISFFQVSELPMSGKTGRRCYGCGTLLAGGAPGFPFSRSLSESMAFCAASS
jgi:hypothetical protein